MDTRVSWDEATWFDADFGRLRDYAGFSCDSVDGLSNAIADVIVDGDFGGTVAAEGVHGSGVDDLSADAHGAVGRLKLI